MSKATVRTRSLGSIFSALCPVGTATGAVIGAVMVVAVVSGCAAPPRSVEPVVEGTVESRGSVPAYAEVAAQYNAIVEPLDTLWSRVAVQLIAPDGDGGTRREQGEGFLQVRRPMHAALSIGKLGETYFYLGSDDQRFWWIDLSDSAERVAVVGAHDAAGAAALAAMGVPVPPLDLVEVLGIVPLPTGADAGRTAWTEDGRFLVVKLPGRAGPRLLMLDPATLRPLRIDLLDRDELLLVSAELTGLQDVQVLGRGPGAARLPRRYVITIPSEGVVVRLALYEPQTREIARAVFDLPGLLRRFRVDTILEPRVDAAAVAPVDGEPVR